MLSDVSHSGLEGTILICPDEWKLLGSWWLNLVDSNCSHLLDVVEWNDGKKTFVFSLTQDIRHLHFYFCCGIKENLKCFSDDSVLFFTAQELFFHRYLGLILSSWFECTLHNSGGWRISSIKFLSCHVHSFIVVELSVKWILDPSPGQAWRGKVVRNDPSPGKWLSVNNRTKTNSFFFRDFKASSLVRKNKSCAYEWVQMTALI